ncbi:MAG: tetratricopeptide repeat protein [Planctomycetes bacterium]|nr:tetratricopeptide repeat protein [Planctomycetota bacterium]
MNRTRTKICGLRDRESIDAAVRAGADYADVHYLLGNLYRDQGQILKAKSAYRNALVINGRYEPARKALSALPT